MTFRAIVRLSNGATQKFDVVDVDSHESALSFVKEQIPDAKAILVRVK